MKNKLLFIIIGISALLTNCQNPEEIESPTTDNQGITRLIAKITTGDYAGKIITEYPVTESNATTYVIPIPWFYPEDSYNETTPYMTSMKIEANLSNNYTLTPALGILDLTKDNHFILTTPDGSKKPIIIKGERTKSNACSIISFSIKDKNATTVIDENAGTITLISIDDLSNCYADYELSPHALSISPDPVVTPLNFNNEVEFTVTAHNGTSTKKYIVKKKIPDKIAAGYRKGSETSVYALDLSMYGFSTTKSTNPSIAILGNNLIVNLGDGSTPIYLNKNTGAKLGSINIGSANPNGSITSDIYGNMVIANYATAGSIFNIFKTKSVTSAPTLLLSMSNTTGYPIGSKISVQGNIEKNAIIIATCEQSSSFVRWIVNNGIVGDPQVISVSGIGNWSDADTAPRFTYVTTNLADGFYLGHYNNGAGDIYYINGNTNAVISKLTGTGDWARGTNILDIKTFNNVQYMAVYNMGYFPQWALTGQIFMYDITNPSLVTGSVTNSPALTFKLDGVTSFNNSATPSQPRTADILLYPSADGFILNMYYIDNASNVLGCYKFDCIEK
jgi:hypothetical protein